MARHGQLSVHSIRLIGRMQGYLAGQDRVRKSTGYSVGRVLLLVVLSTTSFVTKLIKGRGKNIVVIKLRKTALLRGA